MLIISLACSRMCHHSHFSTTTYCWKTTKNKTYMYWLWGRLHSHWALGTVALCGRYADFVHRNVLMWLITLTWTHADISSYTDDLNKQCRMRAGWADKAEQTKALTASRIHTISSTESFMIIQLLCGSLKRTYFKAPAFAEYWAHRTWNSRTA